MGTRYLQYYLYIVYPSEIRLKFKVGKLSFTPNLHFLVMIHYAIPHRARQWTIVSCAKWQDNTLGSYKQAMFYEICI